MSLTFTPSRRQHWTYRLFYDEEGRPQSAALLQCGTLTNPFLSPDFHASIQDRYGPQLAEQELEGRFVDLVGGMFQRSWFARRINRAELPADMFRQGRAVRYWDKAATADGGLLLL